MKFLNNIATLQDVSIQPNPIRDSLTQQNLAEHHVTCQSDENVSRELLLSVQQQRVWFSEKVLAQPLVNVGTLTLSTELNIEQLHNSLRVLASRHILLSTRLERKHDCMTLQVVDRQAIYDLIQYEDYSSLTPEQQTHRLDRLVIAQSRLPMGYSDINLDDLNGVSDAPFRVVLCRLAEQKYTVVLSVHAMVADQGAMTILLNELNALCSGKQCSGQHPSESDSLTRSLTSQSLEGQKLEPISMHYCGYASWQEQALATGLMTGHQEYWHTRLEDVPECHNLILDAPRSVHQRIDRSTLVAELSTSLTGQLQTMANNMKCDVHDVLLASFSLVIGRYSGDSDVVIGLPVCGRINPVLDHVIGPLDNVLAFRTVPHKEKTFADFLQGIQQSLKQDWQYSDIPFEMLVERKEASRNVPYHPIFQIAFSYSSEVEEEADIKTPSLGFYGVSARDLDIEMHAFMQTGKREGKIHCEWRFNRELFHHTTITRLIKSFECVLAHIVEQPQTALGRVKLMSPSERNNLLENFAVANENPLTNSTTLHGMFESQVARAPDSIALNYENKEITYAQLNGKANQLSRYISQELNACQGARVGLLLERSPEYIVAFLAALKAGACVVPLDPFHPSHRLQVIAQDAEMVLLISQDSLAEKLNELTNLPCATLLCDALFSEQKFGEQEFYEQKLGEQEADKQGIGEQQNHQVWLSKEVIENFPNHNLQYEIKPDAAATLIFTSGSSGEPKGVINAHKGFVNRIFWMQQRFPVKFDDIFCFKAPLSFIDHIAEMFQPLSTGNTLAIVDNKVTGNIDSFIAYLIAHEVSVITLVPSLLKLLIEHKNAHRLHCLTRIISSGETLSMALVRRIYQVLPQVSLINLYGSTEVSADVCFHEIKNDNRQAFLNYFKKGSAPSLSLGSAYAPDARVMDLNTRITQAGINIEALKHKFTNTTIPVKAYSLTGYYDFLEKDVMPFLVNVASEHYIGHMTSALPHFMPELSKLVSKLNQNVVKIETSKSLTFVERQVLAMLHQLFYDFSESFYQENVQHAGHVFGIVTSGGTTANVTSMWCARNKALINLGVTKSQLSRRGSYKIIHELGYSDAVIIGSRLLHYSFRKTAALMGLGEDNIIIVEQDENQQLSIEALKNTVAQCQQEKKLIIAIVGIAGATETGVIDPLVMMAGVAQEAGIHFHVDAAWGGALMFSPVHRERLKGIEQADSITFCAHKQLYLSQGISMCLFKDTESAHSMSVHADYQAQVGSYDMGQYTLEGSRSGAALLLHASLHVLAKEGYGWLIEHNIAQAQYFAKLIEDSPYFELVGEPMMNIVNYRYMPSCFLNGGKHSYSEQDNAFISDVLQEIQQAQFAKGETFVSKTRIANANIGEAPIWVFRVVLSNPLTTKQALHDVLDDQLDIANEIVEQNKLIPGYFGNRNMDIADQAQVDHVVIRDEVSEAWSAPIGKPIDNTQVYVLDEALQPVPIGVAGNLFVSGVGVAEGYWQKTHETSQAFIQNPFAKSENKTNAVLYNTGDIACWVGDGSLRFLGRKDAQVKLQGNRVELGEIEAAILEADFCEDASVFDMTNEFHDKTLVAFVVLKHGVSFSEAEVADKVTARLAVRLPRYMVVHRIVCVDSFPRLASGKVNKVALLALAKQEKESKGEFQLSETMVKLKMLWSELLDQEDIAMHSNFFALGGQSVLAFTLISRIEEVFGVKLYVPDVFENATLSHLASLIDDRRYLPSL